MLWNTRYLDAAVARLCAAGEPISDAGLARLSPPGDAHINLLGRYHFPTSRRPAACDRCATPTCPPKATSRR